MNNMFSGRTEKPIPKNLSECIKPDATTTNLHLWAERLENWGKVLFIILIIVGIISTIADTIEVADSISEDAAVGTCISTAINWGLYAFIEYCVYHVLALLISALASITQNTVVSANVALYEASQNHPETNPAQTASASKSVFSDRPTSFARTATPDGMWTCKNCNTNNSLNYGQCKKCGQNRSR